VTSQVVVKLTWTGTNDPSCLKPGATVNGGQTANHPVLYLHGVTENGNDATLFASLFDKVKAAAPNADIRHYIYYQDSAAHPAGSNACDPGNPGQLPVAVPANTAGLPHDDPAQNNPAVCDSQGDVGLNALRLDAEIKALYKSTGQSVILVGYSMGGATIRAFLAYSTTVHDDVAATMVDSVVTMHGVQQGSWLALGASVPSPPLWASPTFTAARYLINEGIGLVAPNPNRPATKDFDPAGPSELWVEAHSNALPKVPYYNTYGDMNLTPKFCFFAWCHDGPSAQIGDIVLAPGTDSPTAFSLTGGQRFAPRGYTADSWQWRETQSFTYNATSPLQLLPNLGLAAISAWNSPSSHLNIVKKQGSVKIVDCKTGFPTDEDVELAQVISNRVTGSTYTCNPTVGH